MEKIYLTLASEAVAHIELKRFKEERKKMEGDPKPLPVDLSGWVTEMQASIKNQMEVTSRSIVQKSKVEIESSFPVDGLKAGVLKHFHMNLSNEIEGPLLMKFAPFLQKAMEETLFDRKMQRFNSRFENIDGSIRRWEAKIPKPFSPELINVDSRFPVARVGFLQERAYDRWLTDALKSKPIFWDAVDYVEKLTVFYETIYKPMDEAEKKAKEPSPEPSPVSVQEKTGKPVLPTEDEGEDETSFARRHPRLGGRA